MSATGFNWGVLSEYQAGGFNLTAGLYAMEFYAKLHQPTKKDGSAAGEVRLVCEARAVPITEEGVRTGPDAVQQWSMGNKAKLSWMPDPDTNGKTLAAVPNPAGVSPLSPSSAWGIFLKSLFDCGFPEGVFTNDISVVDGIWLRTELMDEPKEWSDFQGQSTGEVEAKKRQPGKIVVASEILDNGKPWEGTGGMPEDEAPATPAKGKVAAKPIAKPVAAAAKVAPKPVAAVAKVGPKAVVAKPKAAPAPAADEGADDETINNVALMALGEVLGEFPGGTTRVLVRTRAFAGIQAAHGDDMAQVVLDSVFSDDARLDGLLQQHGYSLNGNRIIVLT